MVVSGTRRIRHTGAVCGLLALVTAPTGSNPGDASPDAGSRLVDAVANASHLMRHRGPDEPGTWADTTGDGPDGTVVLGFNRLSICLLYTSDAADE